MRLRVIIRERGRTPRRLKKAFNEASKKAWYDTVVYWHLMYRDKRFTEQHGLEARYMKRKGELLPRGSKAFRRSYTGKKLAMQKHTRPLEFSGETRRKVKFANITSTSKGGKASYAGASKFSFKHPKSRIRMQEEFRRITDREALDLGQYYDQRLDHWLTVVSEQQT